MIITGADLCVCPDINDNDNYNITGADLCVCPDIKDDDNYNSRCEQVRPYIKLYNGLKQ